MSARVQTEVYNTYSKVWRVGKHRAVTDKIPQSVQSVAIYNGKCRFSQSMRAQSGTECTKKRHWPYWCFNIFTFCTSLAEMYRLLLFYFDNKKTQGRAFIILPLVIYTIVYATTHYCFANDVNLQCASWTLQKFLTVG